MLQAVFDSRCCSKSVPSNNLRRLARATQSVCPISSISTNARSRYWYKECTVMTLQSTRMLKSVFVGIWKQNCAHTDQVITTAELKRTLTNWRLIPHVLLTLCGLSPCNTLLAYGPSLVESWGYGALKANAWVSIGPWAQVIINVCFGIIADKTGLRGPVVSIVHNVNPCQAAVTYAQHRSLLVASCGGSS